MKHNLFLAILAVILVISGCTSTNDTNNIEEDTKDIDNNINGLIDSNQNKEMQDFFELSNNYNLEIVDNYISLEAYNLEGIADEYGNVLLKPENSPANEIVSFKDDVFIYSKKFDTDVDSKYKSNMFGIIDKNGNVITKPIFSKLTNFENGIALAHLNDKTVIIDKTGKVVKEIKGIGPKFEAFNEGFAAVASKSDSAWGFIDSKGNFIVEPQYYSVNSFSEGLAAVVTKSGFKERWGFVDKNGEVVIDTKYLDATDFNEGIAAVEFGSSTVGDWGFIDKNDQYLIEPIYKKVERLSDNFYAVSIQGSRDWTLIDKTNILTQPLYTEFTYYDNDIFVAKKNYMLGVLDSKGQTIIPFEYKIIDVVGNIIRTNDKIYSIDGDILFDNFVYKKNVGSKWLLIEVDGINTLIDLDGKVVFDENINTVEYKTVIAQISNDKTTENELGMAYLIITYTDGMTTIFQDDLTILYENIENFNKLYNGKVIETKIKPNEFDKYGLLYEGNLVLAPTNNRVTYNKGYFYVQGLNSDDIYDSELNKIISNAGSNLVVFENFLITRNGNSASKTIFFIYDKMGSKIADVKAENIIGVENYIKDFGYEIKYNKFGGLEKDYLDFSWNSDEGILLGFKGNDLIETNYKIYNYEHDMSDFDENFIKTNDYLLHKTKNGLVDILNIEEYNENYFKSYMFVDGVFYHILTFYIDESKAFTTSLPSDFTLSGFNPTDVKTYIIGPDEVIESDLVITKGNKLYNLDNKMSSEFEIKNGELILK